MHARTHDSKHARTNDSTHGSRQDNTHARQHARTAARTHSSTRTAARTHARTRKRRESVSLQDAEWVADFRQCGNFYCQNVTRTWHLPKVCSESRLVDSLCAAPAIFCVVYHANYRSHDGLTTVRFQTIAAAKHQRNISCLQAHKNSDFHRTMF